MFFSNESGCGLVSSLLPGVKRKSVVRHLRVETYTNTAARNGLLGFSSPSLIKNEQMVKREGERRGHRTLGCPQRHPPFPRPQPASLSHADSRSPGMHFLSEGRGNSTCLHQIQRPNLKDPCVFRAPLSTTTCTHCGS